MREERLRKILGELGVRDLQASPSGWLHGTCPLAKWTHAKGRDLHPSFGVKPDHERPSSYVCFTCGYKGRISGLIRQMHRMGADVGKLTSAGYPVLATDADTADCDCLAGTEFEQPGSIESKPDPIEEEMFEGIFMPAWDAPESRAYLESGRGPGCRIGEETSKKLGLGWDPDQRRVVFPVRDGEGQLYGFSGRAVDPDTMPKVRDYHGLPKRWLILGQDRWKGEPDGSCPLVLVEGLFAYAHLIEMNLEAYADVGALLGSNMTEQKQEIIRDEGRATYMLFDYDEGGESGLFGRMRWDGERDFYDGAVAGLVDHVRVYVPAWPEGKTDPEELTREEVWHMLTETDNYKMPRRT